MARKTTPEKPPSRAEASIAGRALRTGKASPTQIRSMAGRIESGAPGGEADQEVLKKSAPSKKPCILGADHRGHEGAE